MTCKNTFYCMLKRVVCFNFPKLLVFCIYMAQTIYNYVIQMLLNYNKKISTIYFFEPAFRDRAPAHTLETREKMLSQHLPSLLQNLDSEHGLITRWALHCWVTVNVTE